MASLPVIEVPWRSGQRPGTGLPAGVCCESDAGQRLLELMGSLPGAIVAFSGGVDSTVVAVAAMQSLGGARVVAVTAVSPSLPSGELDAARKTARELGLRHQVVNTAELDDARYRRNAGDRCYFCKSAFYSVIRHETRESWPILNGTNADDLGDFRPGLKAATEALVRSPLAELGLGKAIIRAIARSWGLACHDKPSGPCLASRIAPGIEVTRERLAQVDAAERLLREAGFRELRVRLHADGLARIEVPPAEMSEALAWLTAPGRLDEIRAKGFRFVTLDLAGLRSGSMNDLAKLRLGASDDASADRPD